MKEHTVTWPILGLIAVTRAVLGAGIALLLADRFNRQQRCAVGWTLFITGLLTTIPLVAQLTAQCEKHGRNRLETPQPGPSGTP